MNLKSIVLRERAREDIEQAVDHYAAEAGEQVALGFIQALEGTFQEICRHPAAGSPLYSQALDLPGLRSRLAGRYPYLVFYFEDHDRIDVWRVLHARRDIPRWLQEP